jgi:peptidyl-prolyl cis-trans isomerase A (cyclophilin A)
MSNPTPARSLLKQTLRVAALAALFVAPALCGTASAQEADPRSGKFTIEEATRGLPGKGTLIADITTSEGKLTCELYEKKVPNTVANFVGLARGIREFRDPVSGNWTKRPFYDGLIFHRVIENFMIQGGDPTGTGRGGPGYRFSDEFDSSLKHDRAGILSMANAGPNTNGSQFFVMDGQAPHLDGRHSVFGLCKPADVVAKIARVEKQGSRPAKDVTMKISIRRGKL